MKPEESPWLRKFPENAFVTWVIYAHPADFPDGYVLRAQYVIMGSKTGEVIPDSVAWYADDPEKLRAIIPPGKVKFADPNPFILESWI